MELRFPTAKIRELSARYVADLGKRDRDLTDAMTQRVFPAYEWRGYLTKEEFLIICAWKSPRSARRCESNEGEFVQTISQVSRTSDCEQLRIQIWTLLTGVKWPTASVFLHFAFPDQYPVLGFRALWSLSAAVPTHYTF